MRRLLCRRAGRSGGRTSAAHGRLGGSGGVRTCAWLEGGRLLRRRRHRPAQPAHGSVPAVTPLTPQSLHQIISHRNIPRTGLEKHLCHFSPSPFECAARATRMRYSFYRSRSCVMRNGCQWVIDAYLVFTISVYRPIGRFFLHCTIVEIYLRKHSNNKSRSIAL